MVVFGAIISTVHLLSYASAALCARRVSSEHWEGGSTRAGQKDSCKIDYLQRAFDS